MEFIAVGGGPLSTGSGLEVFRAEIFASEVLGQGGGLIIIYIHHSGNLLRAVARFGCQKGAGGGCGMLESGIGD